MGVISDLVSCCHTPKTTLISHYLDDYHSIGIDTVKHTVVSVLLDFPSYQNNE